MTTKDAIKYYRLQSGLTQEELGQKLGLQKSIIAKYENGRVSNIKRTTIEKMSEIFCCSPAQLLGFDEAPSGYYLNDDAAKEAQKLKDEYDVLCDAVRKVPASDLKKLSAIIDAFLPQDNYDGA